MAIPADKPLNKNRGIVMINEKIILIIITAPQVNRNGLNQMKTQRWGESKDKPKTNQHHPIRLMLKP